VSDISNLRIEFRLTANDDDSAAHLSLGPDRREHDTDGRSCWCGPTFYRVCDDCEDGCWKCNGGKHELTAEEAAATDDVLLIVHRH
jgi:hypothetical protein